MSMTELTSWAVDLKDVGPIYPMVGTEGILFIIGVVTWLVWHVWQIKHEDARYKEEIKAHATAENISKASSGNI